MKVEAILRAIGQVADRGRSIVLANAVFLVTLPAVVPAVAQSIDAPAAQNQQMLVESDQMVYDHDNDTVSAVGNVQIYYRGYTLEAEKVTYIRGSGRLLASGHVKLIDPTGLVTRGDQLDLTEDFADGFVTSLEVETPERTYFSADRADRTKGEETVFVNGTYTACEPCKKDPKKPRFWQVRAAKIIVDHKEKMIYFRDARFEFFGMPIAYLPYFAFADPSVTRKSGFLFPAFGQADELGTSLSVPYYWAPAPNYDVTFTPTYYSRQGFLPELEWRHRTQNGQYTLQMAGIRQMNKGAFITETSQRDWRGGVRTTGEFDIGRNWSYGWDGLLMSDRLFSRNYNVLNSGSSESISFVHLTGLRGTNFFDARAYHFQVLTDNDSPRFDQGRQAVVAPIIDHDYTLEDQVLGGQVSFKSNLTSLYRQKNDPFAFDGNVYYHGLAGTYVRATTQAEWKRQIVGPGGQLITPFAYVRGDVFSLNPANQQANSGLTSDAFVGRVMPAIGAEWSWPIMATTPGSTHIFEPMAQLIVRPNEMLAGHLPNDDAQTLTFSDANLFSWDKFAGYDRVEGGTRLNLGLRYIGTFDSGVSVDGLIGQSYQLAGLNSFATDDIANVAALSGLETDRSDYVARLGVNTGIGPRFVARGRFDESNFSVERGEIEATNAFGPVTASLAYLYLRDFPNNESVESPTSVLRGAASINFIENWRIYGSLAYDITNAAVASNSLGLAYDNSCFTFALAYSETLENYSDIGPQRRLSFVIQMRTLASSSFSTSLSGVEN